MARGIHRSEEELGQLAGYRPDLGTTPKGMMRALILIAKDEPNLMPGVLSERREDVALLRLLAAHRQGAAAILCVDNLTHWVVSFGTLGDQIIHIADSADDELVLHYSPAKLVERWRAQGVTKPFYGILV